MSQELAWRFQVLRLWLAVIPLELLYRGPLTKPNLSDDLLKTVDADTSFADYQELERSLAIIVFSFDNLKL